MRYWRYIDLGDHELIASKVLTFIGPRVDLETCPFWTLLHLDELKQHVPELFAEVRRIGTEVHSATLLTLRSDSSTLHIDHPTGTQKGVEARVNLPILNTAGSTTAFFEMTPQQWALSGVNPHNGTRYWNFRHLYKPVTTVEVNQPTVLRISAPHTVYCIGNLFPRLTLSIALKPDAVQLLDAI